MGRRIEVVLLAVVVAAGPSACAQNPVSPDAEESATEPVAREGAWMEMHEANVRRAREGGIDLLFLGDSITQMWQNHGLDGGSGPAEVWERYYGARRAANFGIGGDRTQHLLWRLDHGEVDGISPRVVVLLIGTNNLRANTPAEVAAGIKAVVARLRATLPASKILLLGLFPRGKRPDSTRERIKAVNERIARLDDGATVRFLDIGRRFLNDDGTISEDVMPEYLHLTRKGYRIWADAMEPTLGAMLDGR